MGVLKDLFMIASEKHFSDIDPDDFFHDEDNQPMAKVRPVSYDSVAKQAKQGIMQFPIISSRALSYDIMMIISKASERNFASFLQTVFTMNQVTSTDNPKDFIKQYHQNMSSSVKGPGDMMSLVFNSSEAPQEVLNGLSVLLNEANFIFEEQFELKSINDKFIPINVKNTIVSEASNDNRQLRFHQGDSYKTDSHNQSTINYGGSGNRTTRNTSYKEETHYHQPSKFNPYADGSKLLPKDIFVDNDARKANELIPTLMHVRILKEMGEESKFIDFICGVKAVVHPVDSADMVKHLVDVLSDHGTLFKLIRWTTGELSFFKDIVFSIDQMKDDVKEIKSGKASTWWRALKNIKASRRLHKFTRTSPVLPNATFVVSQEEADYIKANHGFDILSDNESQKIMKAYGLLQFGVVDAASEVAHFFLYGDDRYSVITFKGLERQNGDAEKQFKDILRAVNKLQ